ncbi:UNVERIFIED_CONTAM: hypothetical protein FKN15_047044 [Acipenser sinensis]
MEGGREKFTGIVSGKLNYRVEVGAFGRCEGRREGSEEQVIEIQGSSEQFGMSRAEHRREPGLEQGEADRQTVTDICQLLEADVEGDMQRAHCLLVALRALTGRSGNTFGGARTRKCRSVYSGSSRWE